MATHQLDRPGGPQTYCLTVAEHLTRLGHGVTLFAREQGAMAALARERKLRVAASEAELPAAVDGALVNVDRSLALEVAERYPEATRVFVVHGTDDIHLPPPVPGAVMATVAMNDRFARLASASAEPGEVVRLRQPVDIRRFAPRNTAASRPRRVLLLGNYQPSRTMNQLKRAWAHADLEWRQVGGREVQVDPVGAIADADVVVGYGRSILEAMACARPAYVHDHAGSDGWVTAETYPLLEAGGFAGMAVRSEPTDEEVRADLDLYDRRLGAAGHLLARSHHDARDHAASLVELFDRLGPGRPAGDPSAVRALAHLAEAQLRAEISVDHYRMERNQWFKRSQELQEQLAGEQAERAALIRTRRYRLASALSRPLDLLRRRG